jgi:hypothetical protein
MVAQGRLIEALGETFSKLTSAERAELRKGLRDGTDNKSLAFLFESWVKPQYTSDDDYQSDKAHLFKHWFPPPGATTAVHGGWWEDEQPIERVMRAGLIALIDLLDAGYPPHVDFYWVCAGGRFQVVNCVSGEQITVLLLTPHPPFSQRRPTGNANPGEDDLEKIWISKHHYYNPGEKRVDKGEVAHAITTRPEKPE